MPTGVVKWFDSQKGFGFIQGADGGADIFVHYSSIQGEGFRSLKDGDSVEYELAESDKGPQAREVRRTGADAEAKTDADAEAGSDVEAGSDAEAGDDG